MKKPNNEIVTKDFLSDELEKFAAMVKRGFDDVMKRFDDMVTKKEFYEFKDKTETSLYDLKTDMVDVKGKLMKVEDRLDSIEDILQPTINQVNDHEERITKLEFGAA